MSRSHAKHAGISQKSDSSATHRPCKAPPTGSRRSGNSRIELVQEFNSQFLGGKTVKGTGSRIPRGPPIPTERPKLMLPPTTGIVFEA
jgi:hypothetical protein